MTDAEDPTLGMIRMLVEHIAALTAKPVATTPANARLLEEVDCLLTSALGLLNEATGTPDLVACQYRACNRDHCSMLTREECGRRRGTETGSCGTKSGPGLDTAIRACEDESQLAKGA